MKKLLLILILAVMCSSVVRAGEGKDETEMFKGRLNISDHFNKKFTVTEEELIKVITKKFTVN
jgi:hypothetical protein